MNRILSSVPRRELLVGGALVLALALVTGIRSPNFAATIGWYGAPACDDLEAQNPGDPNGCLYDAHEGVNVPGAGGAPACADGQDNDSDELTDCLDPDCLTPGSDGNGYCAGTPEWCNVESAEFAGQSGGCGYDDGVNKCGDGEDNDSDGLYDCADPDCAYGSGTQSTICASVDPTCAEYTCSAGSVGQDEAQCGGDCSAERCNDGQDNDGNGSADCGDPSCVGTSACVSVCSVSAENNPSSCGDGSDNDSDGRVDCDDADCDYDNSGTCWWSSTGINPANWFNDHETACSDGSDNDGDGFYDCADVSDCGSDQACSSYCGGNSNGAETSPWGNFDWSYCGDGEDNDGDSRVDCRDADCVSAPACSARPCEATEQDADGNCEADNPYWGSSCGDGSDNDSDGRIDCDDSDCAGETICNGAPVARSEVAPDGVPVNWSYGNGFCVDNYNNDPYNGTDGNARVDCWDPACDGQDPVCYSQNLGGEGWPYGGTGEGYCGDQSCGVDENAAYCPQDCGGSSCPNGVCDNGETSASCPSDCGAGLSWCGDGRCADGEDCSSCSTDCGNCVPTDYCGDGTCGTSESCTACQVDCGACSPTEYCNDGACNNGEDCGSCPNDCGTCTPDDYCGNGTCGTNESCSSCSTDCGECPRISEAPDCSDGTDNEGDGFVDCGDPDCSATSPCNTPPTTCYTANKSAIEIAMEAGWDENGNTNVATWNRTPSGGWNSRVTDLVQSQVQGLVRSAILNSLAGDGHVILSAGICVEF